LNGLDHGIQPPRLGVLQQFPLKTFQPQLTFVDGLDVLLKYYLLRRGQAHHIR